MSFISWKLPTIGSRNNKLAIDEISITVRDNNNPNYTVMFNTVISQEMKKNGITYVDIQQDDLTQEIAFVFNKIGQGVKFRYTHFGNADRAYAMLSNKEWVTQLLKELNLPTYKNNHVKITGDLSRKEGFMCYKIIK